MEFKGTKGKWVFDDINMVIKGEGIIEGMTVIANVSPRMNYTRGMTTQCANAQLIAAAPELLNMLQRIRKESSKVLSYFEAHDERVSDLDNLLCESIDIISKALGKEADDE